MKQVSAKVISIEKVLGELERPHARAISGSYIIWLDVPEIAVEAKPGQYAMVRCGADTILPRPFSIHRAGQGRLALFFAAYESGRGTTWLSQRKPGDSLSIFGPLGNGFSVAPNSKNLLLSAGGIGIAPLRFLADKAVAQGKTVTLLWGASKSVQLLPAVIHGLLPQVNVEKITEDEFGDYRGVVTDIIINHVDWADQVFACGPLPMYRAMAGMPELKNKPAQVSLEVRMGCGRGVCYGCTVKTKAGLKKVCEDGPVFELSDIMWDELGIRNPP